MGIGSFHGLNTALRGLMAQQAALDTTSHNIANLNTEGYSRQRAEMSASSPITLPGMNMVMPSQIGTGVQVQFARLRDTYLDTNMRDQLSRLGDAEQRSNAMQEIEALIGEPSDSGISALMQGMFGAMEDVAANPDDLAARTAFAQAADALASRLNQLSQQLTNAQGAAQAALGDTVIDINATTARLAELNTMIRDSVQAGMQPNDLRDERDMLLDRLSKQLNITTSMGADEQITVQFGSAVPILLVNPATNSSTPITVANLDTAYANGDLRSGSAFALKDISDPANGVIAGYLGQLDDLAASMVAQMNAQNAAGFDQTGAVGGDLWNPAGVTAATMQFDAAVLADPRRIAASGAANEPGNSDNMNALLNQRNTVQGAPLNATWEGFFGGTVASVGTATANAMRAVRNQTTLVDALQNRREQASGVSLDEEMSNMLRFQHAYSASARVMTTIDDMLDTLINRMGRVGL